MYVLLLRHEKVTPPQFRVIREVST